MLLLELSGIARTGFQRDAMAWGVLDVVIFGGKIQKSAAPVVVKIIPHATKSINSGSPLRVTTVHAQNCVVGDCSSERATGLIRSSSARHDATECAVVRLIDGVELTPSQVESLAGGKARGSAPQHGTTNTMPLASARCRIHNFEHDSPRMPRFAASLWTYLSAHHATSPRSDFDTSHDDLRRGCGD